MAFPIEEKLVVGVASSALFQLAEADEIFHRDGLAAYREYQRKHQYDVLMPGVAFPFIKRLLNFNGLFPDSEPVEVVLLSHNDPDTGLRVFNSITHYNLGIVRAAFTTGDSPYKYIPAFNVSLFLSANDSTNSQKAESKSKNGLQRWIKNKMERMNGFANEEAFPEYYVKRDLFFPLSCKPYSYYQDNLADETFQPYETESVANIYKLPEISVRSDKGGLRKINRSKPALTLDAYRVFNDALDLGLVTTPRYYQEGLSETVSMLNRFPLAYTGDYGTNEMPKIRVEFNNRSKSMGWGGEGKLETYRYLKYTRQFKLYTDFAPRERGNERYAGANTPEIVFNAIQYDESTERQTYRDRYIILSGFAECDAFYSPDYSNKPLPDTKDYRRTLYWNPDIRLKPGEKKTITFYNNSKKTRLSVDAEGLGQDGTLLSKQIGKK